VSTTGLTLLAVCASPRRPRHERGFTLIELVTCIVIIGLLAAVAGPKFFGTQPFSERGYASEIASALRSARHVAVASACEVRITINPVTGYQAVQRASVGNDCLGAVWTTPVMLSNSAPLSGSPPSGVTATPATIIIFDGKGQASSGAVLTIGSFTVRLDAVSGFVSVQ
jgi:prepilin-type N-terminal cleavage/methylation domain-containing protein